MSCVQVIQRLWSVGNHITAMMRGAPGEEAASQEVIVRNGRGGGDKV